MSNEKKWGDLEIAAVGSAVIIMGSLLFYWVLEIESMLELLELAYGSAKLFNNPLVY